MIDAKLAAEKLQEVATMVDMRFGHGTWKGIVAERARRIQEQKEAVAKARREQLKKDQEFMDACKVVAVVGGCILVIAGLFVFMMISVAKAMGM